MTILSDTLIPLKQHRAQEVNNIDLRITHLNDGQKQKLFHIIDRCPTLFSDPDKQLTYTTRIKGEIRTTTDTPVYSRAYPYPMALKSEVEKQVNELLREGIIRPSRSPYNSPVWIVPKKEDASGVKKYRMVIDYRKLNSVTVPDRYPIPEINEVLSNLGKNQYFTTIDLKSGFHQIPLKDSDVEKTAFSVNNGKFEFVRLPFGLKNAPSIFQRTLDDILREHIAKRCYVYIDDIVIFGKDQEEHLKNLELVFKTLEDANLKVQLDKCEFLQREVEFLGFIVGTKGIKPNPKKVQAIINLSPPRTLKELRSFLGMSGYYRRFVRDYAKLAKPLTTLLRGEDGRVSKNASKNKSIQLDAKARSAFEKLKNTLISEEVMLSHPNFDKEFELTTDASDYALGAVLMQDNRAITFISRTLSKTEENYATNEKEMLAIIWSLNSLRNFLYGSRKVKIFTDHQPLTYALSNKNTNSKMKRWKSILEEYNYVLEYKPGRSNVVADTLSRPPKPVELHTLTSTQHSDDSSSHNLIPSVEVPINVFRNQIILKTDEYETSYQTKTFFSSKHIRHIFTQPTYSESDIIDIFKRYANPNLVNGLLTSETVMGRIQEIYLQHFNSYKFRYTQLIVNDIEDEDVQNKIISVEHKRAHRNAYENRMQILRKYYFPKMAAKISNIIKPCTICKENKYERHPNNQKIHATPIPEYPGHTIHIDIFSTEKQMVLTAIDKFSKFAQAKLIESRAVEHIKKPLQDILFYFCVPVAVVVIDNEKALNSASIISMMRDNLKIEVFTTPPFKSEVNGQVERFHSTLSEIMRCLKAEGPPRSFEQLLERAVNEYNFTIHSTTRKKPVEIYFGRTPNIDPDQYERVRLGNIAKLRVKQEKDMKNHNKKRKPAKQYSSGDVIYVKHNKRIGSKLTVRFVREIVKENKNSVVTTESGRTVHKSNIRN